MLVAGRAGRATRGRPCTCAILKAKVLDVLLRGGFLAEFGRERVWPTKADAIRALYKRFDVPVCTACTVRIFTECHVALPNGMPRVVAATV